jgi:hypothetical protein
MDGGMASGTFNMQTPNWSIEIGNELITERDQKQPLTTVAAQLLN